MWWRFWRRAMAVVWEDLVVREVVEVRVRVRVRSRDGMRERRWLAGGRDVIMQTLVRMYRGRGK